MSATSLQAAWIHETKRQMALRQAALRQFCEHKWTKLSSQGNPVVGISFCSRCRVRFSGVRP